MASIAMIASAAMNILLSTSELDVTVWIGGSWVGLCSEETAKICEACVAFPSITARAIIV